MSATGTPELDRRCTADLATDTVTSADGTTIAYAHQGAGDPLVLIDGALNDSSLPGGPNRKLAPALASQFTVYTYDRRGRGASGDSRPRAIEREVEDLQAVIDAAGGSAYVYGISSGGALALEAANRLESIRRLALYELPFVDDDSRTPIPSDFAAHLTELADERRDAEALRYFFIRGIGLPRVFVAAMRLMPVWSKLKVLAHTLPYDAKLIGDAGAGKPLPGRRWANVTVATLVIAGAKSQGWTRHAMRSLADILPMAEHRELDGQTHIVKAKALAPVLSEFFRA